jgi:hypothetical protein
MDWSMYDISGKISLQNKITKAVLRERLIEGLQRLSAEAYISDENGAVEFKPAPKNRGKHPLKNITIGQISLAMDEAQTYVTQLNYRLSLLQMRISLLTISLAIWAYSLIRGYNFWTPLAIIILAWIFGYAFSILTIRSRFQNFLQTVA